MGRKRHKAAHVVNARASVEPERWWLATSTSFRRALGGVVFYACLCVASAGCSENTGSLDYGGISSSGGTTIHGAGQGDGCDAGLPAANGGSTGSGGAFGSGGASTGAAPAGGASGSGDASSDGESPIVKSCTFTQSSKTSAKIATVGIVTWSTTLSKVTSAKIDFGLDVSYGMTAPVPSPAPSGSNTTLLLGMKQKRTYHYRISASNGETTCSSDDYTIGAGSLPNGLFTISATTKDASALYGGYLVTGLPAVSRNGAPAYIVDADGEIVWSYPPGGEVLGAVMSYDGTHLWTNSNSSPTVKPRVHRISMDGLTDEDLSSKFVGLSHQLTILPDETVAFFASGANGCEDIKEYAPSGVVRIVVNAGDAQGESGGCHVNNIQYAKDDDTLVFSDLYHQSVVKVRRSDGSTVWRLNGSRSDFSGDGWLGGQHGVHVLGLDRLLIFNNNTKSSDGAPASLGGSGDGSIAIELKLDLFGRTVSKVWSYKASPGIPLDILGDVQRLPNGNTIVAYSTAGVVHEVDANGALVQQLSWSLGGALGYIEKRATLYGSPPR
jgi:Arylsulfotransferase (ASST)